MVALWVYDTIPFGVIHFSNILDTRLKILLNSISERITD